MKETYDERNEERASCMGERVDVAVGKGIKVLGSHTNSVEVGFDQGDKAHSKLALMDYILNSGL